MSASMDFSQVGRLSANLGRASAVVSVAARSVLAKGALNVKNDTRRNVSKHPSWRRLAPTVNYELVGLAAEIGYDDRGQGELAGIYEFGSSRRGPHPTLIPALAREAPRFHAAMAAAMAGVVAQAVDPKARRDYTTRDGRTIQATNAQIDNWTRGRG